MTDLRHLDCFEPELVRLERMNYFPRQLLDADAMRAEQDYFLQKLRRHNRYLHGWGVVCGLKVTAAATDDLPWRVEVGTGYALGPYGDEVDVAEPVHVDLARCGPGAVTDPCEPDLLHPGRSGTGGDLFLAIKYAECVAKPVKVMPAGCACEEEACEYSRIRDSFQIECLKELPPSHEPQPESPNLCDFIEGKLLPRCPPCPSDPWVVLAHVTLPVSPTSNIADSNIDNFVRRQVFSTAVLQEQLIACCCDEKPQPIPLLKVENVRIFQTRGSGQEEVFNWVQKPPDPANPITVPERADVIEITFSEALQSGSVSDGQTFNVTDPQGQKQQGTITSTSPNVVRWKGTNDFRFPANEVYTVTLRGDLPLAIISQEDRRLDGEPKKQLPSGNGQEGGNFTFKLLAQRIIL